MPVPLLLADWIEGIIPLVVVGYWILKAFLDAKGGAAEPVEIELNEVDWDEEDAHEFDPNDPSGWGEQADRRQPAAAQFQGRNVQAAGVQAGNAAHEQSEVDDFLRRLAQQKELEAHEASQEEHLRRERIQNERRLRRKQQRDTQRRQQQQAEAGAPTGVGQGGTVDEHVRQHMGHLKESTLAEQAAHLGEQVAQADDRVAARLHEKFDHKLGKLQARNTQRRSEAAAAAVLEPTSAESIAALLANPDSIRNAIVLNEILQRPTDRWE